MPRKSAGSSLQDSSILRKCSAPARKMCRRRVFSGAGISKSNMRLLAVFLIAAAFAASPPIVRSQSADVASLPSGPDSTLSGLTAGGSYRLSLRPTSWPVPIGKMHDWVIRLETAAGATFVPRQLVINGGMPGHGHGLPSAPRVTKQLDDGEFLIEGMKFNMGGRWQLVVGITGPSGADEAIIEFSVNTPTPSAGSPEDVWSELEIALLKSLSLQSIGPVPRDPSNRLSQRRDAALLGGRMFFDKGLSSSGRISCATCHRPDMGFSDGRALSFGTRELSRNAPGLLGAAYHQWFYWDGRRDSLWSQSVTPIESPGEMENNRVDVVRYVLSHPDYADSYSDIGGFVVDIGDRKRFPPGAGPFASSTGKASWFRMTPEDRTAVNRAFSDIGKVIAAYMETLRAEPSRFDRFVAALVADDREAANELLNASERRGLKLFLDPSKTQCLRCHNGPMFTNFGFHNIATAQSANGVPEFGRMMGLQAARVDEFNCTGMYSDASKTECTEFTFAADQHGGAGAFKVPTLRNLERTAPYMHDGRYSNLTEVLRFYNEQPGPELEPHELPDIDLSEGDIADIVAFLKTLSPES